MSVCGWVWVRACARACVGVGFHWPVRVSAEVHCGGRRGQERAATGQWRSWYVPSLSSLWDSVGRCGRVSVSLIYVCAVCARPKLHAWVRIAPYLFPSHPNTPTNATLGGEGQFRRSTEKGLHAGDAQTGSFDNRWPAGVYLNGCGHAAHFSCHAAFTANLMRHPHEYVYLGGLVVSYPPPSLPSSLLHASLFTSLRFSSSLLCSLPVCLFFFCIVRSGRSFMTGKKTKSSHWRTISDTGLRG